MGHRSRFDHIPDLVSSSDDEWFDSDPESNDESDGDSRSMFSTTTTSTTTAADTYPVILLDHGVTPIVLSGNHRIRLRQQLRSELSLIIDGQDESKSSLPHEQERLGASIPALRLQPQQQHHHNNIPTLNTSSTTTTSHTTTSNSTSFNI